MINRKDGIPFFILHVRYKFWKLKGREIFFQRINYKFEKLKKCNSIFHPTCRLQNWKIKRTRNIFFILHKLQFWKMEAMRKFSFILTNLFFDLCVGYKFDKLKGCDSFLHPTCKYFFHHMGCKFEKSKKYIFFLHYMRRL